MNALHQPRATLRRNAVRGFTLIELMITVAIVAILARIALPSYFEYIKRGKMTEAFNTLSSYSLTLSQWYQDNRTYTTPAAACTAGTMAALPTGQNFTYSCSNLTATTYLVTATGQNSLTGFVYTVDQNGFRASTAPASSGWPNSLSTTSCWVSSKSGSCY